jgi:hypothetical protein
VPAAIIGSKRAMTFLSTAHANYLVRTITDAHVTTSQFKAFSCYNAGGAPCASVGSDFVTTGPFPGVSYSTLGTINPT